MADNRGKIIAGNVPGRARGVTLIGLLIVMAIMGGLISIAAPNLKQSIIRAREAVLMEVLCQIREAIEQYYTDNGKYPVQLGDLINSQDKAKSYLRSIPNDPITSAPDWITVALDSSGDSSGETGIFDVHSASPLMALDGTAYNTW